MAWNALWQWQLLQMLGLETMMEKLLWICLRVLNFEATMENSL
jgi:hypothetical protein